MNTRSTYFSLLDTKTRVLAARHLHPLGQVSGSNGMDEIAEDDIVEEAIAAWQPDRKKSPETEPFKGKDQRYIPLAKKAFFRDDVNCFL